MKKSGYQKVTGMVVVGTVTQILKGMDKRSNSERYRKEPRSGVEKKSEDGWVSQEKEVEQGQD